MKDEEINRAIAEACGHQIVCLDYCRDHNAMADARHFLNTPGLRVKFLNTLRSMLEKELKRPISDFDLLDSKTRHQSEAFLRTINKWKEQ